MYFSMATNLQRLTILKADSTCSSSHLFLHAVQSCSLFFYFFYCVAFLAHTHVRHWHLQLQFPYPYPIIHTGGLCENQNQY